MVLERSSESPTFRVKLKHNFRTCPEYQKLLKENIRLKESNQKLEQELDNIKLKKQVRVKHKHKRKCLQKRNAVTISIYRKLIQLAAGSEYKNIRLRIAICLLTITGLKIGELLLLKVSQVTNLKEKGEMVVNTRTNSDSENWKSFITREGKKLLEERREDFEHILSTRKSDAYVFTTRSNHHKPLTRETLTRAVNQIMRAASKEIPGKPNLTSHSFRIGYIAHLRAHTQDIEFVRQNVGYKQLETTSAYNNRNFSNEEREQLLKHLERW